MIAFKDIQDNARSTINNVETAEKVNQHEIEVEENNVYSSKAKSIDYSPVKSVVDIMNYLNDSFFNLSIFDEMMKSFVCLNPVKEALIEVIAASNDPILLLHELAIMSQSPTRCHLSCMQIGIEKLYQMMPPITYEVVQYILPIVKNHSMLVRNVFDFYEIARLDSPESWEIMEIMVFIIDIDVEYLLNILIGGNYRGKCFVPLFITLLKKVGWENISSAVRVSLRQIIDNLPNDIRDDVYDQIINEAFVCIDIIQLINPIKYAGSWTKRVERIENIIALSEACRETDFYFPMLFDVNAFSEFILEDECDCEDPLNEAAKMLHDLNEEIEDYKD